MPKFVNKAAWLVRDVGDKKFLFPYPPHCDWCMAEAFRAALEWATELSGSVMKLEWQEPEYEPWMGRAKQ